MLNWWSFFVINTHSSKEKSGDAKERPVNGWGRASILFRCRYRLFILYHLILLLLLPNPPFPRRVRRGGGGGAARRQCGARRAPRDITLYTSAQIIFTVTRCATHYIAAFPAVADKPIKILPGVIIYELWWCPRQIHYWTTIHISLTLCGLTGHKPTREAQGSADQSMKKSILVSLILLNEPLSGGFHRPLVQLIPPLW